MSGPVRRFSRASYFVGVALVLLFIITATLCVNSIRHDRFATYLSTHPSRLQQLLPGESFESYKAWSAWRTSWTRSLAAAALSGVGAMAGTVLLVAARTSGKTVSRWLLAAIFLHLVVVGYFVFHWGPDFKAPAPVWMG